MDDLMLPRGSRFERWLDQTAYTRAYHVAQNHPAASDDNPGTPDRPLASIARAADLMQPGEKAVIHEGVYRECVRPARGGTAAGQMIAYEAAANERVILSGAEAWQPTAVPSAGWSRHGRSPELAIWMADLPETFFGAYNPFLVRNAYDYLSVYGRRSDPAWLGRAMLRRGMIFFQGRPLKQVLLYHELVKEAGTFWVEASGLRVHFRLPEDRDPAGCALEVTAREQVFAPLAMGLSFIRVSGFHMQHAADGFPVPQRAVLSTTRGHHWIIEDNAVEWCNAVGIDIGCQSWDAQVPPISGHHIVRRNRIRHCGVCGLAGALGVYHTLVEDNLFEHIGHHDMEEMWECAAIKFHLAQDTLIRRNIFRHLRGASGVWLDVDNRNCRISANVFADIVSLAGGIYSEMNFEPILVDHNLLWDVRGAVTPDSQGQPKGGYGIRGDCNETLTVAHNFLGRIGGEAVYFTLFQSDRQVNGRTGLCRDNAALNNVFYRCPQRIQLGRLERNRSDGNLFDQANAEVSFGITHPAPGCRQNLAGWQEYFSLDQHSTEACIKAEFDLQELCLRWCVQGPVPVCQPVAALGLAEAASVPPGPLDPAAWSRAQAGEEVRQVFPRRSPGQG